MPYGITTTHTRFREYKRHGTKAGKCLVCGRTTRRQRTFRMTESPYNKNPDGTVRSPHEIARALDDQVRAWKAVRVICTDCEHDARPPQDAGWTCAGEDLSYDPASNTWGCARGLGPDRMMCSDCWRAVKS